MVIRGKNTRWLTVYRSHVLVRYLVQRENKKVSFPSVGFLLTVVQ